MLSRCGDGACNGTDTCANCPQDGCCAPPIDAGIAIDTPVAVDRGFPVDRGVPPTDSGDWGCGDFHCNFTETCATCPHDCLVCDSGVPPDTGRDPCLSMASTCGGCTPIAQCGWCGALRLCMSINSSCTGPASGTCASDWSCNPSDCPASTDCRACSTSSGCPSNACLAHPCDGRGVCRPTSGRPFRCDTVNGTPFPATCMYDSCFSDTECGPTMRCRTVFPGQTVSTCLMGCVSDNQCPTGSDSASAAPGRCVVSLGVCRFSCDANPCPSGLGLSAHYVNGAAGTYCYCM